MTGCRWRVNNNSHCQVMSPQRSMEGGGHLLDIYMVISINLYFENVQKCHTRSNSTDIGIRIPAPH